MPDRIGELMWWRDPFAAIDTETTGLNWYEDRVIQVGMSFFNNGVYLGGSSHIINSGRPSCQEAMDTHHITDEMQQLLGENPSTIFPMVSRIIQESRLLVIMNAPFDLNFLLQEMKRLNSTLTIPYVVDPLVIDRFYSKNRIPSLAKGRRTLKAMSERYGIHDYPLHNAGHDSRRVGELAIEMAQRYGQLARSPLSELMKKQRKWHGEWSDDFAGFADAKGFFFNRVNWPYEGIQCQIDQLPLDLTEAEFPSNRRTPLVRRARPSASP